MHDSAELELIIVFLRGVAVGCLYETHRSLKTGIVGEFKKYKRGLSESALGINSYTGLPNVGKSTLFNAMMGSAAAAVDTHCFERH